MSKKIIYGMGLIFWILTLFGYYQFVGLNPWYWIFGVIYAFITLYHITNYTTNLFWTKFDEIRHEYIVNRYLEQHTQNQPKYGQVPTIDVFLPICGEDLSIIQRTWYGVKRMKEEYEKILGGKVTVYVGDDKGDSEAGRLANQFGFVYLPRPADQRGHLKKAGNILHLFTHSRGEYYVVFDADFCPRSDFLLQTVPYLEDKSIGILQTPQAFRPSEGIEYGAGYLQHDFYNIIQVARSRFNACICVGSNAIYQRLAISKAGLGLVDHGEDVHTGLQVQNAGYIIKYLPKELAWGDSPKTISALLKQHNRWCSSSTGMFLSGKVLRQPGLNWIQKLMYHIGFAYYAQQMFNFILPFQLFVLIFNHFDSIHIRNAWWFYPYIFWAMIFLPMTRGKQWSPFVWLANTVLVYTHTVTFIGRLFGRAATWVPTGIVAQKDRLFEVVSWLNTVFVVILFGLTILAINRYGPALFNPIKLSVTFWIFYNLYQHTTFWVAYRLERARL
jgi:cellulose synthase (UDP-forming)